MKQVLTVSCKLRVTSEQVAKIEATLRTFADACEYINQTVGPKLMNELAIQSLVYHDVRARFGLSSQLAIHAMRRVSGNRKTAKKDGKPVKKFVAIVLEDLTGIREPTNQLPRTKKERRLSNSWAFYQLRQFLTYKAIKHGVKLVFVDPRYTSQTCHNCYHIHPTRSKSYRHGKRFVCGHCGWNGDADYNGANNLATIGALVNVPRGSGLSCSLQDHFRATESPNKIAST